MFKITTYVTFLSLALLGCDQSQRVGADRTDSHYTHIEVYYRDFDGLAPVSYSKDDLINFATARFRTEDQAAIEAIDSSILSQCIEVQAPSPASLDYYLLILFFNGRELQRELASSGLYVVRRSGASEKVCELSEFDRDRLAEWIEQTELEGVGLE